MRCELIAELATNFGGDLQLAKDMISAAADSGADWVKTQAYQVKHLRKDDPQYAWFKQCELGRIDHERLMRHAEYCGVRYLSTAYTRADAERLYALGLRVVKVGSGEGRSELVNHVSASFDHAFATVPWGEGVRADLLNVTWLATVPLYPMPPECYARVTKRDGWSDHAIGIDVAKIAIQQGARVLEKHFHLPNRGCREQAWNMTPDDLKELRRWAEVCAQAVDGTKYEGRWSA